MSSHLNLPVVILRTLKTHLARAFVLSIGKSVSSDAEKSAGGIPF